MTYEVTLNSGVTLFFNGRKLTGYHDPRQGVCVDATVEKNLARENPNPSSKTAAKAENAGLSFPLFGTYLPGGAVGCGGNIGPSQGPGPQTNQLYNEGVNITPSTEDGKGGAMAFSSDQIFPTQAQPELDPTGERYVIKPIQIENVHIWGENLSQVQNLYIVIESDPTLIQLEGTDQKLPCVAGMVNLSTADPIEDAKYDFIRLPLFVTKYTIASNETEDTISSSEGYRAELGAACGSQTSGQQVKIQVPQEFYANNQLNINLNLTLEVDATNVYNLNTQYSTYLRIRLKAE